MNNKKIALKPLTHHPRDMLRNRGLDPRNYLFVKNTYTHVYFWDIRYKSVKVIVKQN